MRSRQWTLPEDRLLFEPDQSLQDLAERLGRTKQSVRGRRQALINAGFDLPRTVYANGTKRAPVVNPHDCDLGPERPCARCGTRFQPTVRLRLLCKPCFGKNDLPPNMAA